MKKIKIEEAPKLQFNRGNPDSPVLPDVDDHDLTEDDEDQTTGVESNGDTDKDEDKEGAQDKMKNTEMLTF